MLGLHCCTRASLPRSMWDLSSPTRDRTRDPCIGRQTLNHWTTREFPISHLWGFKYPKIFVRMILKKFQHSCLQREKTQIGVKLLRLTPLGFPTAHEELWSKCPRTSSFLQPSETSLFFPEITDVLKTQMVALSGDIGPCVLETVLVFNLMPPFLRQRFRLPSKDFKENVLSGCVVRRLRTFPER